MSNDLKGYLVRTTHQNGGRYTFFSGRNNGDEIIFDESLCLTDYRVENYRQHYAFQALHELFSLNEAGKVKKYLETHHNDQPEIIPVQLPLPHTALPLFRGHNVGTLHDDQNEMGFTFPVHVLYQSPKQVAENIPDVPLAIKECLIRRKEKCFLCGKKFSVNSELQLTVEHTYDVVCSKCGKKYNPTLTELLQTYRDNTEHFTRSVPPTFK